MKSLLWLHRLEKGREFSRATYLELHQKQLRVALGRLPLLRVQSLERQECHQLAPRKWWRRLNRVRLKTLRHRLPRMLRHLLRLLRTLKRLRGKAKRRKRIKLLRRKRRRSSLLDEPHRVTRTTLSLTFRKIRIVRCARKPKLLRHTRRGSLARFILVVYRSLRRSGTSSPLTTFRWGSVKNPENMTNADWYVKMLEPIGSSVIQQRRILPQNASSLSKDSWDRRKDHS